MYIQSYGPIYFIDGFEFGFIDFIIILIIAKYKMMRCD